jgi:hypothetical protein
LISFERTLNYKVVTFNRLEKSETLVKLFWTAVRSFIFSLTGRQSGHSQAGQGEKIGLLAALLQILFKMTYT